MIIVNRRKWIGATAAALGCMRLQPLIANYNVTEQGHVVGDPEAARVGGNVLRNGGNWTNRFKESC